MSLKIAQRPSQIADCVAAYLKEENLEGVVSMFHPQVQMFFPPTEPPKIGKDAVREVFAPFCAMKPTWISNVISEVVNGDTALLMAKWRIEHDDKNILSEGESVEVAKKMEHGGGGWVYFIDCPNGPPALSANE